jgi:peptide deformylase
MTPEHVTAGGLELLYYPDPRLRQKATPVGEIDDEVKERLSAMVEILHRAQGIGLAATQVGWMVRLCLVNPSGEEGRHEVLINPEIFEEEGRAVSEEGCLSLPGIYADVTRPETVRVRYLDLEGNPHEREADGILATVIQHEVDHLDGILFITKISPADRLRIKKQLTSLERAQKESREGAG